MTTRCDAATAQHQILVWGAKGERSAEERLLSALAGRLLALEGDAALGDYAVAAVLGKAQLEIACGWSGGGGGGAATAPRSLSPVRGAPEGLKTPAAAATKHWILYSDGSCLANGTAEARAGFGVFVVDADGKEVHRASERLSPPEPQTNQRAELRALQYAMKYAVENDGLPCLIYCDSRYAMDCVTKWAPMWEVGGWRKADGKPILHLDIIKPLYELRKSAVGINLAHVPAHTGASDSVSRGNAVADALANQGALLPPEN
jgi:ribonuclease HI